MSEEKVKKVTCREATTLLNSGAARMAHFRDEGPFSPPYSDEDPALVWIQK